MAQNASVAADAASKETSKGMFRSYVISWNLTQRCNLRCEHCYIEGGPIQKALLEGEMDTGQCQSIMDQIAGIHPNALLILTGGEPLLRPDIFELTRYATELGLWCVMGTNGVLITETLVDALLDAGLKGVSLSLDGLDPETHDAFRKVRGAFDNTVRGSQILKAKNLPFIVQTTIGRHNLHDIADIAREAFRLGAHVFNLFFLVPTGRGTFISDIEPEEYEAAMQALIGLQKEFEGRMLINAKCAPHFQRVLYGQDPESPFLKSFSDGAGGCPAGTHYLGIRPDGRMTPCPYLPVYGGSLKISSFREIWESSPLFQTMRNRGALEGRCGTCEFNRTCGGCRARAFGHTGQILAEDPWCVYQPGAYGGKPVSFGKADWYGMDVAAETGGLIWSEAAKARLQQIPAFVRGMVSSRVENYARKHGLHEVTLPLMNEIRAKMGDRFRRFRGSADA